jgi:MoxR-like ATPase
LNRQAPSEQEEVEILSRTTGNRDVELKTILNANEMVALQELVREVEISPVLLAYTARLVRASRPGESDNDKVLEYVRWGAGPRAGQALVMCAKAHALLRGHFAVTMDDIRFVAHAVLRHRILLNFQAEAGGIGTEAIIDSLLAHVTAPISPLD